MSGGGFVSTGVDLSDRRAADVDQMNEESASWSSSHVGAKGADEVF